MRKNPKGKFTRYFIRNNLFILRPKIILYCQCVINKVNVVIHENAQKSDIDG